MAQPRDLQPLVAAQGQTREEISAQLAAITANAAAGFTGWYSTEQITAWAARLARAVEPLLRMLARNTDAYMARTIGQVAGRTVKPVGAVDVTALRDGVTHAGAYARAADVYRYQQAQLDQIARAVNAGDVPDPPTLASPVLAAIERVRAVAEMDAALAVRNQAGESLRQAADRGFVTGWRRVIHPELARSGTCGLCVAASDRAYGVHRLLPVHQGCHCVPAPISHGNDPGSLLNDSDLARLYGDAGSTARQDLARTRYVVNEHGELGPVLSATPIREPGPARRIREPMTDAQRAAALKRLHMNLTDAVPKVRTLARDEPAWGGYRDQLDARVTQLSRDLQALAS